MNFFRLQDRRQRGIVLALILAALGYLGNVLSLPMFFGVDFLFGSLATTIAAIALGPRGGGVVALVSSLYTLQLWGHSYAAIIFTLEAVWLGWCWRRGRQNLVVRDLMFWCAVGMPLVVLFYRYVLALSWKTVALIALKQSVNGIFCTSIVAFLMLHTPFGAWLLRSLELPRLKRGIQQITFNFLVAIVFIPIFGLTIADSRLARNQLDAEWQSKLQVALAQAVRTVEIWQENDSTNLIGLEQTLREQPFEVSVHLRLNSDIIHIELDRGTNFPGWENLESHHAIGDRHSHSHDDADRGMDRSNSGAATHESSHGGHAEHDLQEEHDGHHDRDEHAGHDDRDSSVTKAMSEAQAAGRVIHYLPKRDAPPLAAWRQSFYSLSQGPTRQIPLSIQVSVSAAPQISQLESLYVRNLSTLMAIVIVVAGLANVLGRDLAIPLQELARLTTDIPKKLTDEDKLAWPHFSLDEVQHLSANFQRVSVALQSKFQEVYSANEALESRVRERTAELETALTDLKGAQVQLVHTEKMSSLGQLVAGVAHEINNPVSFIHGNLTFTEEHANALLDAIAYYEKRLPDGREALEDLDLDFIREDFPAILKSMRQGTERIEAIVESLRSFSRLNESEQKIVNPIDGIEDTLRIVEHRLKATRTRPTLEIVRKYEDLSPIACYPGQLNQVFLNLIVNAIDALEGIVSEPTIAIAAERRLPDGSRNIEIAISDNGCGIPTELRDRIFEPFFTTKQVGDGTGMGLAVCHSVVVEAHGGQLDVESSPRGTTFTVRLPHRAS
ncbi:MAG: ATP-binding protein [Geitlerinemataceae cyanobacterium]